MKRIESKNQRFLVLVEQLLVKDTITASELAQALVQKLKLTQNTSKAYSSQLLTDLAEKGVMEKRGRSYSLSPRGWAALFNFISRTPFAEKYYDLFIDRLSRSVPAASAFKEPLRILRRVYARVVGEPEKLPPEERDLLNLFRLILRLSPPREVASWEDALSAAMPDIGVLRDRNIFYSMLRDELKQADELTRSAMKDLLGRLADSLHAEARGLEREVDRRRSIASELAELAKAL
ncbi:MAG: hypothetical protein QXT33_07290 [Thermofilum sp.]